MVYYKNWIFMFPLSVNGMWNSVVNVLNNRTNGE